MAFDAGAVVGSIELRYDKVMRATVAAEQQVQRSMGRMTGFVKKHQAAINAMGRTMVIASAAVAGAFVLATRKAILFDAAMRNVNTIARLTEDQLKRVSSEVIQLSMETGESATILAAGLYDIYSAGYKGADALNVLAASAKAAVAGISDTATAAGALLTALASWDIAASRVNYVSDILFKTVERGRVNFQQLAMILSMGAGMAKDVGVSLEEFGAAVAVATARTIRARSAGEYFRQMMTSLIKPSTALTTAILAINENITEFEFTTGKSMITALGLGRTMQELKRYSDAAGVGMEELFSEATALQFALALTSDGGTSLIETMVAMDDAAGATGDAFEEQGRAVERQLKIAKESINALAITIGYTLLPSITKLINQMTPMVQGWLDFAMVNQELIRNISMTTLKLTGVTGAVGLVALALSSPTGLAVAITAVSAALILGIMYWDEYWEAMGEPVQVLSPRARAFQRLQEAIEAQAEAVSTLDDLEARYAGLQIDRAEVLRAVNDEVRNAQAAYDGLTIKSQEANDAAAALERRQQELQDRLNAVMAALTNTGDASSTTTTRIEELEAQAAALTTELAKLETGTIVWTQALRELETVQARILFLSQQLADVAPRIIPDFPEIMPVMPDIEEVLRVPEPSDVILLTDSYEQLGQRLAALHVEWQSASLDRRQAILDELRTIEVAMAKFPRITEEVLSDVDQIWQHTMERIQDSLADTFGKVLAEGGHFKDWWNAFCDSLRQIWAELMADILRDWLEKTGAMEAAKVGITGVIGAIAGALGFAKGGLVTQPTLGVIAENEPEAVIPLSRLGDMQGAGTKHDLALAGAEAGGGTVYNFAPGAIQPQIGVDSLTEWDVGKLADRLLDAISERLDDVAMTDGLRRT